MAHPLFRANQQKTEAKRNAKPPPLNFGKSLDYLIKEWQALEELIKMTEISLRKQSMCGFSSSIFFYLQK